MRWLLLSIIGVTVASAADRAEFSYRRYCNNCHDPKTAGHTPDFNMLRKMSAESVLKSMESGAMKSMSEKLTKEQRRALAEYVSGKKLGEEKSQQNGDKEEDKAAN